MHSLNLSVSQSSKVREIRHCLDVLKDMCNFFKYAKRHSHLKQVIIDNADVVKKTKIVGLCATRFVERYGSILVAKELLPYVAISL